jgi:Plavaka transposase
MLLTLFCGKMAYPVYLTIGNIPKEICQKLSCHAQMLIGYLPTTKLEGIQSKAAQCCALVNLFHSCMKHVLGPISHYSETGIAMVGRDGVWCRCHPILASFVGNYPEQVLVTCTYYGHCPKCLAPWDQLGEHMHFLSQDHNEAIKTYFLADGDICTFHVACCDARLKPVFHPFWESFPLADIFLSITPDVLHQLLQGVMKHLISWLVSPQAFGQTQINVQCQIIPPNHHIKLFSKGITTLSHISGKEYKNICNILLGLVVDVPLPCGQPLS